MPVRGFFQRQVMGGEGLHAERVAAVGRVTGLVQADGLDAEPARGGAPFGHRVDADHPLHAEVPGDPRRELPDRSKAEHGQRAVLGHVGVDHCLVGGG